MIAMKTCRACKKKLRRFPHVAAKARLEERTYIEVVCKHCHHEHWYDWERERWVLEEFRYATALAEAAYGEYMGGCEC